MRVVLLCVLLSALCSGSDLAQQSARFELKSSSFASGGTPPTSAAFRLAHGSVGGVAIGAPSLSSPSFGMAGGFVAGLRPATEVDAVVFDSQVMLSWQPDPFAVHYNVYRGMLAGAPDPEFGSCVAADVVTTTATVGDAPLIGETFFYLVTGTDRLGRETTKGSGSSGLPRNNANPCP